MRRAAFGIGFGALILGMVLAGMGCDDQEAPRSLVYVSRIAESPTEQNSFGEAYQSDLITDEGTVFEDEIYISFKNVPRSNSLSITPEGPFGSVVLTDFRVDYSIPGEYVAPILGKMHVVVPSGEEVNHQVVLVTAKSKVEPPLASAVVNSDELMSQTTLTFMGYEETSEDEIEVKAYIQIHFANWTDEDS